MRVGTILAIVLGGLVWAGLLIANSRVVYDLGGLHDVSSRYTSFLLIPLAGLGTSAAISPWLLRRKHVGASLGLAVFSLAAALFCAFIESASRGG